MAEQKHSHYYRAFPWETIDVYRLIEVYEITCPAAQHILKKVIATGKRGHKDLERDWQDIADTAQRKIEMLKEDKAIPQKEKPPTLQPSYNPSFWLTHGINKTPQVLSGGIQLTDAVSTTTIPEYEVPCGYVPRTQPTT